ncbi:MAG: hypothetical protein QM498_03660 [Desulfobacterium sp.]
MGKEKALPVTRNGTAPGVGLRLSAQLSQIPYSYDHCLDVPEVFPAGKLDADLQHFVVVLLANSYSDVILRPNSKARSQSNGNTSLWRSIFEKT